MGQCRICLRGDQDRDGVCFVCFKYNAIMQAPPIPFKARSRVVTRYDTRAYRNHQNTKDDIAYRNNLINDQVKYHGFKGNRFFNVIFLGMEQGMPRITLEQKFNPFFMVPRGPEGVGSFIVGKITSPPKTVSREKQDKSGKYDTGMIDIATVIDRGNGETMPITFALQDINIPRAIADSFPKPVMGKTVDGPVGKYVGIVYFKLNDKGYFEPDLFVDKSLTSLLNDMNSELLEQYSGLNPEYAANVASGFKYSEMAWTPGLIENLKANKVIDDIPFL